MTESARESPRGDGAPVGRRVVIGMVLASGTVVAGGQPALTRLDRLLHRAGGTHPIRSPR